MAAPPLPTDPTAFPPALKALTTDQLRDCAETVQAARARGRQMTLVEAARGKGYVAPEATQAAGAARPARRIGPYEIQGLLGRGAMGEVYLAIHAEMRSKVALKILPAALAADEEALRRFLREARSAAALDHPNIVRALNAGEDRGFHYLALEFVEGESLAARLERAGRLPEREALLIVLSVAHALHHAHGAGLVHRDIKPANILISKKGVVKLADLGLARKAGISTSLTQSGVLLGTPLFISPEQANGVRDVDIRSDIYSLGATLYLMVTGRPPFDGETPIVILHKHIAEPLVPPILVIPSLSEGANRVVERMLAKDRDKRVGTPARLIEEIQEALKAPAKSGTALARKAARAIRFGPARFLWRPSVGFAAAGALAALLLAVLFSGGGRSAPSPLPRPESETAHLPPPPPADPFAGTGAPPPGATRPEPATPTQADGARGKGGEGPAAPPVEVASAAPPSENSAETVKPPSDEDVKAAPPPPETAPPGPAGPDAAKEAYETLIASLEAKADPAPAPPEGSSATEAAPLSEAVPAPAGGTQTALQKIRALEEFEIAWPDSAEARDARDRREALISEVRFAADEIRKALLAVEGSLQEAKTACQERRAPPLVPDVLFDRLGQAWERRAWFDRQYPMGEDVPLTLAGIRAEKISVEKRFLASFREYAPAAIEEAEEAIGRPDSTHEREARNGIRRTLTRLAATPAREMLGPAVASRAEEALKKLSRLPSQPPVFLPPETAQPPMVPPGGMAPGEGFRPPPPPPEGGSGPGPGPAYGPGPRPGPGPAPGPGPRPGPGPGPGGGGGGRRPR